MKILIVFFTFIFFTHQSLFANSACTTLFLEKKRDFSDVRDVVHQTLKQNNLTQNAKGYAVILTAMLATSAASSFFMTHFSKDYAFMTYFVSQFTILGIIVMGAPVWEPLSSYFRNLAFKLNHKENLSRAELNKDLEESWLKTQGLYSINSQMSRNILSLAFQNIQTPLYEAYRAFHLKEKEYAVQQIVMILIRLKNLFQDIAPNDKNLIQALKAIFPLKEDLKKEILRELFLSDEKYEYNKDYYMELLNNWVSKEFLNNLERTDNLK